MLVRMWDTQSFHTWLVVGWNGKAASENSLTISYKNTLTYESAVPLLDIYLWEMKAYAY